MKKTLFRAWRLLPLWIHILAARILRTKFRVAVAAIVFDERGRILLFKHTYRKFQWGIPAGSLEYNEQPEDAVVREFFEEVEIKIKVERLLLADSSTLDRNLSLIYLCRIAEGEFRESSEISEMQYFPVDDLPPMLYIEKDLIRRVVQMLDDL